MDEDSVARGRQRDRAVVQTLLAGAGVQFTIIAGTLVSLPFITRELSTAEYGVLATLSGFVALLAFADLGIGSSLTTRVSTALGAGDIEGARSATATAVVSAGFAGFGVSVLGLLAAFVFPWQAILGAEELDSGMVVAAVASTALCVGLSIPASLGQRALYGLHRGPAANRWLLFAAVGSATASVLVALGGGSLPAFVLASLGTPALVGVVCTVAVLRAHTEVRPTSWRASPDEWRRMLASSGWFFVIALAAAVGFQADALIVSSILGASSAGVYGIAVRLFGLINQCIYPALLQLWPAFGDAYTRGEMGWIRSRLVRATIGVGLLSGLGSLVLVLVGEPLIGIWLTEDLAPPTELLVGMAAWTTFSLVQAPMYLLFNGAGRVRAHALLASVVAVINVPLSIWMTHEVGIAGPVLGSLIASVVVAAGPGLVTLASVLRAKSATYAP